MHIPVLLQEIIEGLAPKEGDIILDTTIGDAGHAVALCKVIGISGKIYGLDEDENAVREAKKKLEVGPCNVHIEKDNFKNLDMFLKKTGVNSVNKIIFDLGLRSGQLETRVGEIGRGFSFRKDELLLMTWSASPGDGALSAHEILNSWSAERLQEILKEYGEERFARRIAEGIVESRKTERIKTTLQLVEIIKKSVPKFYQRGPHHVARKTFQALRIAVNDELSVLREGLLKGTIALSFGGRIAVISYHSLEDRIVKFFFREMQKKGDFKIITKKPIVPTRQECLNNPRARSAKLRILEKISPDIK